MHWLNDSERIQAYKNGNQQAFTDLVKEHSSAVYTFVARMCGNAEEANDLTQQTFVKAWKNLNSFDTNKNFRTWLFAIAKNTTIDYLRKHRSVNFSALDTDDTKFEETVSDPEPLPPEIFERKELAKQVSEALLKINEETRSIIVLRMENDMTFQEIAETLGKPLNTITSKYRRGLVALRDMLVNKSAQKG